MVLSILVIERHVLNVKENIIGDIMKMSDLDPLFLKVVTNKTLLPFCNEWFECYLVAGDYHYFTVLDAFKITIKLDSYGHHKVWVVIEGITVQTIPELLIQNIYDYFSALAFETDIDKQKFLTIFYKISTRVVELPTLPLEVMNVQQLINILSQTESRFKDYVVVFKDGNDYDCTVNSKNVSICHKTRTVLLKG